MYAEGLSWEEVSVTRVHTRLPDLVSCLAFDNSKELLWAGTERGWLSSLQVPSLARFTTFRAQAGQVADLLSVSDGIFSVGPGAVCLHSAEGVPKYMYREKPQASFSCSVLESMHSSTVVVGHASGGLSAFNLTTGATVAEYACEGVSALCPQSGRGMIIAGATSGRVFTMDARNNYKQEQSFNAHPGGLSCIDVKGDILVTCGYTMRMGRKYLEAAVKVFDMRSTVRLLSTIPFTACPSLLAFHPKFSTTLMVAAPSGLFALADVNGSLVGHTQQVDCHGDSLCALSISSSGEAVAFGGTGGYVHLWARSKQPRGNTYGQVCVSHPPYTHSTLMMGEDEPLSMVPSYAHHVPPDEKLLSAVDGSVIVTVGLPPKVIDPSLLQSMKQVDFVGYIPNPKYTRGAVRGQAAKAVASLRNMRQKAPEEKDTSALKAARARERMAQGGIELPDKYKKMSARVNLGARRFAEFNFNAYNRTRFAGLENDIANCYANALLQCLHFIPGLRTPCLTMEPEAEQEFHLLCELGFLFRMFRNANGAACQASNFLRALRQNRDAAALGVLEGQVGGRGQVREGTATDIEVEANKDRQLSQRVQRLCGFLMEQLHKEAGTPNSFIDALFGITLRQRTVCLLGHHQPKIRETRTFQVKLHYPSGKERPTCIPPSAHTPIQAVPAEDRPSFSDLLKTTLHNTTDMRAWFDEKVGYAPVRVTRCAVHLPPVLVVGCGPQDRGDLAWWVPYTPAAGVDPPLARPWLPLAIAIDVDPEQWKVEVYESDNVSELLGSASGGTRVLYELSAVICHVWDEDELGAPPVTAADDKSKEKKEGHLVAHIKVPPPYYQRSTSNLMTPNSPSVAGAVPSPFLEKGLSMKRSLNRSGSSSGHLAHAAHDAAAAQKSLDDTNVATSTPDKDAEGPVLELQRSNSLPDSLSTLAISSTPLAPLPTPPGPVTASPAGGSTAGGGGGPVSNSAPAMLRRNSSTSLRKSEWMMFNDFCVAPTPVSEVREMFGTQKSPCLLYYSQVTALRQAIEAGPPPFKPTCSVDNFLRVCNLPPLQGAGRVAEPLSFVPFGLDDLPVEGKVVALDAEFVAMAPPEKTILRAGRGLDIETRPSRLCVARISVVRGDGQLRGTAAIDDYIRMVEPVYDYLTKFSGLVAGDLDPNTSQHYLTTLKAAYTKLQFLIDSGCIFVGHGLKQDFRMINLVVPPHQVVDTVDLFHLPHQRFVSLRFLASYFLALHIQTHTHDSIEDAKTALKLYQVYKQLVSAGNFEESLINMYRWGNEHGWTAKCKS